ncbi:hypothetical protein ILUMI_03527 [Ignelater luminosus]|uniref:Uncharacterized protein n=1 Tax=Ignelater luminosus TaxID=2038154 RepID=A0A8K0DG44_IGNLU|nr:hypothetical protein ILUMI_03527 [Ignelater luminosus]
MRAVRICPSPHLNCRMQIVDKASWSLKLNSQSQENSIRLMEENKDEENCNVVEAIQKTVIGSYYLRIQTNALVALEGKELESPLARKIHIGVSSKRIQCFDREKVGLDKHEASELYDSENEEEFSDEKNEIIILVEELIKRNDEMLQEIKEIREEQKEYKDQFKIIKKESETMKKEIVALNEEVEYLETKRKKTNLIVSHLEIDKKYNKDLKEEMESFIERGLEIKIRR